MDVAEHIISLERSALDRWIRADPDGYLSIYTKDATYFDPFRDKRLDGLDELNVMAVAMRGITLPFTEPLMRIALNVTGVLFLLVGCVWFLQGINILPGSFMTGQKRWAVYGGLLLVAGIALLLAANRRRV